MAIVYTVNGEHFYSNGKHVDEYRAEDQPVITKAAKIGERTIAVVQERFSQAALAMERMPLSYAQLMDDIFN